LIFKLIAGLPSSGGAVGDFVDRLCLEMGRLAGGTDDALARDRSFRVSPLSSLRLKRRPKHVGDKKCDLLRIHGETARHHLLEPFPAPEYLEVDLADLVENASTLTIVVEPLRDIVVIVHRDVLHQGPRTRTTDGKIELRTMPTA
jgi:hypothetical protein